MNDVSISTMTVNVKALVVGKKQFTVIMLKQLPQLYECHENGKFVGSVWGYVKYHIPSIDRYNAETGYHFHLIILKDNRLYRYSTVNAWRLYNLHNIDKTISNINEETHIIKQKLDHIENNGSNKKDEKDDLTYELESNIKACRELLLLKEELTTRSDICLEQLFIGA
jgi:hypothetical protein